MSGNNNQKNMSKLNESDTEEFSNDDSDQRNFKDFQVVVNSKNQVVIKNFNKTASGPSNNSENSCSSNGTKKRQSKGDGSTSGASNTGSNLVKKLKHENFNKSIYIGTKNAEKWDKLKNRLKYKNDVEFVSFLLNLVEKYVALDESTSNSNLLNVAEELNLSLNSAARNDFYNQLAQLRKSPTLSMHSSGSFLPQPSNSQQSQSQQNHQKALPQPTNLKLEEFRAQDHSITSTIDDLADANDNSVATDEILDYRIAEKIENDLKEKVNNLIENVKLEEKLKPVNPDNLEEKIPKTVVKKKKLKQSKGEKSSGNVGKSKPCWMCGQKHEKNECPVETPVGDVKDKVNLEIYKQICEATKLEKTEEEDDDDDECEMKGLPPYADASCPLELDIVEPTEETRHGASVIAKEFIPKYTRLGPLIGEELTEPDVVDDSNMRYIFEIYVDDKSRYFDVENKNISNWVHYLRPAPTKDKKNLVLKVFNNEIYFVTCVDIQSGCELLYWSGEINTSWTKKTAERTNCGGCNLKFDHPIYYRTHCSIFHDVGFSLTIKKYHCKICKISVLGKENIMKHAETMHEGKGAYQCQFCKKFFLRLNYLDMHRTYGCSANPDRARPLCDFCGRKFCQPQKLKVHIKRMHSDLTDVLRDFQCKLCSKLLGSRAALQRHCKEVHNRESGFVNCPRCQKLFQNRSNLKIHMLTHSGVRPFKCAENDCTAAFTTKQCLQFHYKKVHGYTQEQMPKIERSVAYTFDAYSGGLNGDTSELDEKMYKPRKRREKSLSLQSSENLSDLINSCQEALELTKRQEIKDSSSMDASQFNDSYSERTVDQSLMQEPKPEPPMSQDAPDDDDKNESQDETQPNSAESTDKPLDDTLNIYRNVDLPSDDDDENPTSNEEAINDMLESTTPHPTFDKQFPFSFVPRSEDANSSIPAQANFNPLTSAFTAHPQASLLNFFTSTNKSRPGLPTSAMLVEAALNSVSDASNEFIENVASGDDNNIDIESVPHKTGQTTAQPTAYLSDNSIDENEFKVKNGQVSASGSSHVSKESKKSELPLDVTYSNKKATFDNNFEDGRTEFESCSRNQGNSGGFMVQRDFYPNSNSVNAPENNDSDLNFSLTHDYKKYDKCFQYLEEMKNLNETLKEQKRDVMSTESADCHFNAPQKLRLPMDDLHLMNKLLPNELDLKFKTSRKDLMDNVMDFRSNFTNPLTNNQMYSSLNFKPTTTNDFHNDLTMTATNVNNYNNRYQHHIHDILSDKEQHSLHADQSVQQQQQQDIHSAYIDHHLTAAQHTSSYDHTEQQSINLCKTADYNSCMSPMPQNYASHSEMLQRMNAAGPQDLCTSMGGSYMTTNNSPPAIHHPSFLNTQLNSHNNRELSDHHRLLAPDKFVASRLLVDPVAHRFIEQHNRLLGTEMNKNDQKSLGLSLYHQQLPSHQSNPYHHEPVKASANNLHANYHHLPFSAYYQ